jgi:hypothetical protein
VVRLSASKAEDAFAPSLLPALHPLPLWDVCFKKQSHKTRSRDSIIHPVCSRPAGQFVTAIGMGWRRSNGTPSLGNDGTTASRRQAPTLPPLILSLYSAVPGMDPLLSQAGNRVQQRATPPSSLFADDADRLID